MNEDLRLLARFNASWSDSSLGEFYDADYMEAVAAFAYRPVDNDRLNMLFKYTYFADLPTAGQISSGGTLADYGQRSHVLAIDGGYDVLPYLTVGGKYAFRLGELRDNRVGGQWFSSMAQLGIVRADLHLVREWDFVLEGRVLDLKEAGDQKYGALAVVYRHINDNMKVEGELRSEIQMNIKRLQDIGCYRGIRHRIGLPVRGQHTKNNARTRRGKKHTIANKKKVTK